MIRIDFICVILDISMIAPGGTLLYSRKCPLESYGRVGSPPRAHRGLALQLGGARKVDRVLGDPLGGLEGAP